MLFFYNLHVDAYLVTTALGLLPTVSPAFAAPVIIPLLVFCKNAITSPLRVSKPWGKCNANFAGTAIQHKLLQLSYNLHVA